MRRAGLTALLLLGLPACPGSANIPPRDPDGASFEGWIQPDHGPWPDQPQVGLEPAAMDTSLADLPGGCTPEDATTSCDPITPSGCLQGAGCYIVQGSYVDCVCPAGALPTGSPCTTTTQCAPGNGCVGDTPPGTCRQVCDPSSPTCGAGLTCKNVSTLTQYGMCVP